jgi:hypothetical protein
MVDDIIPGVIISEMPKLRSTTLTRVDLYLEPPPLPPLSLVCPSRAVERRKKVCKCFTIDFFTIFDVFFHQYRRFFHLRELYRISSPSPHRGMWATFRRIGADVGGYENDRGDP